MQADSLAGPVSRAPLRPHNFAKTKGQAGENYSLTCPYVVDPTGLEPATPSVSRRDFTLSFGHFCGIKRHCRPSWFTEVRPVSSQLSSQAAKVAS